MTTTAGVRGRRAASRLLVGRVDDLARLRATYAETVERARPSVVFVEGPAGIGKTRVAREFTSTLADQGIQVLVGRCVAQGEEILPYAPMVEALTDLVRREGAAEVLRLAGTAGPELARLVPSLGSGAVPREATPASSSLLFQALCALLNALADRTALVLVIEDLHWADRSTREMLLLLAHQLRGPVLLVVTLRTDEAPRDPGVVRFTAELGRRAEHHIALEPLTREEQAHQISDILGVPPRRDLLDEIYLRAEGNPFFAEELLALGRAGDLPTTIRDLLLVRLDTLAPATRQVLRAASVVGRRVPHRLLEAISDVTGPRLEQALRPAVEEHVLVAEEGGSYQFRHALLQESVASGLLPGESARLHRRLAEVLTASPDLMGGSGSVAGRVALHWYAAGDDAKALVSSVVAARDAKQALAFNESLSHYERALTLLDTVPDGEALLDEPAYWLLWSAAEMAHLAAHPERAAELARQAIAVVDPDVAHHHGYLYERLGRYLWMAADGQGALAAYETAVELVPADPPTRWRAAVLSGYAQILMLASRFAESRELAEEAITIAAQVADGRSVEGHARCNLGVDLARLGDHEAGVEQLLEARRIAEEEFSDVDDIARAMVNLWSIYADAGRLAEAAEVALDSIGVVQGLGLQRRKGVWCRCDACWSLMLLGRYDDAERLVGEAYDLAPQGVDLVRTLLVDGQLLLRRGRLDEAAARLERSYDAGGRLLDGQLISPMFTGLVELHTWQGDFDAADRCAAEGLARLSPTEDPTHAVPFFSTVVAAIAERAVRARGRSGAGDLASTELWLARAEASIAQTSSRTPVAEAHLATARCEADRAHGRSDPARWLDAAATWEALAVPERAAYTRLRAGEALLAGGGARAAAQRELSSAWSTAERIGAGQLSSLIEGVARRARIRLAPVSPDSSGDPVPAPYHLTPREQEVLALVADGLTDRAIGARLYISHRTVERHVSNLLAKLDATGRSELTAVAHRTGLAGEADRERTPRPLP